MGSDEVGAIAHLFVTYNASRFCQPDTPCDEWGLRLAPLSARERVALVAAPGADRLVLPGGLRASDPFTGDEATPGCCCGLEGWRAWLKAYTAGESPWLGHDPWMSAERQLGEGIVRVRSGPDYNLPTRRRPRERRIDIPLCDLPVLLEGVRRDLLAFRHLLARWVAQVVGGDIAPALADSFDRHMDVSAPLLWPDHFHIAAVPFPPTQDRDRPLPRRRIGAPRRRWNKEEHDETSHGRGRRDRR